MAGGHPGWWARVRRALGIDRPVVDHIPDELQQQIIRRQEVIERNARATRESLERLRQEIDARGE